MRRAIALQGVEASDLETYAAETPVRLPGSSWQSQVPRGYVSACRQAGLDAEDDGGTPSVPLLLLGPVHEALRVGEVEVVTYDDGRRAVRVGDVLRVEPASVGANSEISQAVVGGLSDGGITLTVTDTPAVYFGDYGRYGGR